MSGTRTAPSGNRSVVGIALVAGMSGILFGYDTGVIAGAQFALQKQFEMSSASLGFMVAAVTWGAALGALLCERLADDLGRRSMLRAAALVFCAGVALQISANWWGIGALIAGRLVLGVAVGFASTIAPMYVSEVAPPAIRGRLVAFFQLAITVGILLSEVANALLQTRWELSFGVAWVLATVFFLLLFWVPRSPRWLVMKGHHEEARAVLTSISQTKVVEKLSEIETSLANSHGRSQRLRACFEPAAFKVLALGMMLAAFQQFTGVNAVFYYGPLIVKQTGIAATDADAIWASLIFGTVNVVATFIAIRYVDSLGRRWLMLVGALGLALSNAGIGAAFYAAGANPTLVEGWLILGLICVFIVFFAATYGPILWVLLGEMFPNRIRGAALPIAICTNWVANAVVGELFPVFLEDIGPATTFMGFGACCFLVFIVVKRWVPETKGKSLEELERVFLGRA